MATSETADSSQNTEKKSEPFRNICCHYSRGCSLVSPCCNKVYPCRLCHDEKELHEIDRFAVKEVVCRKCNNRQVVAETCEECSLQFARYYCSFCHLYDDAERGQYHCSKCGICRIGGRDNFFHCDICGLCLQTSIKDSHKCVQQASRSNCPVCMEDIHTSRNAAHVPECGHLLHKSCYKDMLENGLYQCPQCQTSLVDMSSHWQNLDNERQRWLLPMEMRDFKVKIQCRDCRKECEVSFHFIGLKCSECGSYNTVRTGNETLPLEDVDPLNPETHDIEIESLESSLPYDLDLLHLPLPLHEVPSTDSEEYESISSPDLSKEEDEFSNQLLGGIPLLPPWFPQHSESGVEDLVNQLPVYINLNEESFDEEDEEEEEEREENLLGLPFSLFANPSMFANSFMPTHSDQDSDSGLPYIWEVEEPIEDEEGLLMNGGTHHGETDTNVGSDGWETDSEEEVIGGDEENLGKEVCHLSDQEESHPLGDIAPAH